MSRDAAAIVGFGTTEFSRHADRTELQLACEAITAALGDVGISATDGGVPSFEKRRSFATNARSSTQYGEQRIALPRSRVDKRTTTCPPTLMRRR